MGDERTGRRSIGDVKAMDLRPTVKPALELRDIQSADLLGEVAKSKILAAANEFMRENELAWTVDFSLSFSLSW